MSHRVSIWGQVRRDDSALIRGALSYADRVWSAGGRLEDAVQWVERAADFAASEGNAARAHALTAFADDLRREVARRSGMPARTDRAWDEAQRLQSSLIHARGVWTDSDEAEAPVVRRIGFDDESPSNDAVLVGSELPIDASIPNVASPDGEAQAPQDGEPGPLATTTPAAGMDVLPRKQPRSHKQDAWLDETSTSRRNCRRTRDEKRPPLGSINALSLLTELESVGTPRNRFRDGDVSPLLSSFPEAAEVDRVCLATMQSAVAFQDLSDEKAAQLARAGSLLHVASGEQVKGVSVAVVLDGSLSMHELERDRESSHLKPGDTLSLAGSVLGAPRPKVFGASVNTSLLAWDDATIHRILDVCPWVIESLRVRADELLTRAAIPLSTVARHMGQTFYRALITSCRVLMLPPGSVLMEAAAEVRSVNIAGVGVLELVKDGRPVESLKPGTVLFAEELRTGAPAPVQARAGVQGATILRTEAREFTRFLPHVPLLARVLGANR